MGFLGAPLAARGVEPSMALLYPTEQTVMEFGIASFSVAVPSGLADSLRVSVNGVERASLAPARDVACFSVPIAFGRNEISITATLAGKPVQTLTTSIFRRSDLESQYATIPDGFRRDRFHAVPQEACTKCHAAEMKGTGSGGGRACLSCHAKIAVGAYVHGPVAVGSCESCHSADVNPKFSVAQPVADLCFSCHQEQRDLWKSKKYMHGPVTTGRCTICHNPHSSENAFGLHKATWYLCTTCHADRGSGKHVLGHSFSTEGHPTKDRPDPRRPGKELSCASCHDPHASGVPQMWVIDAGSSYELCGLCHQK